MIGALYAYVGYVFNYCCLCMCFKSCVGGEVSTMGSVDLDLLSHFEIQDICVKVGGSINSRIYYLIPSGDLEQGLRLKTSDNDVTYMCELHAEWPTNEITLYVEPEVEPIAIKEPISEPNQPIAVKQPWKMNDEDDDTDCEEVANIVFVRSFVVDQNDVDEEPVEGLRDGCVGGAVHVDDYATHGQTIGSEDVHVDEPNWLDEGYEGPNYPDDIFGAQNNEVPNMRERQRDIENVNEGEHLKEPVTDNGKRSEAAASDQATDDNDWAEKTLDDDDTRSINNSEDGDDKGRCPEFNKKTDMSNPQLCKGIKFPNGKVFRIAIREHAVQKPADIKFKLNEKTNIFVHCKYECGWRVYASQISGELTFQIKTMVPTCTYRRTFKYSQLTFTYMARKYLDDFNKNHDWAISSVKHRVM